MLEIAPMVMVIWPSWVSPPEETYGIVKVAAPCVVEGLMVKVQESPGSGRTMEVMRLETPVGSLQEMA